VTIRAGSCSESTTTISQLLVKSNIRRAWDGSVDRLKSAARERLRFVRDHPEQRRGAAREDLMKLLRARDGQREVQAFRYKTT
jgi:hypothetical protein